MAGTFHSTARKSHRSGRKAIPPGSRLVIVGNGMVSARFCELLVEQGLHRQLKVTVVGAESRPAYNRVKLSTYVDSRDPASLEIRPYNWYADHQISLITGSLVESLNRDRQFITLSTHEEIPYDFLVFATGSRPFIPPIEGVKTPGVHEYRTLADLDKIIAAADGCRSATVIGGGLLGLEAAQALQALGLEISVIERATFLMPQQLNKQASAKVEEAVREIGLNLYPGIQKTRISEDLTLELDGKDTIKADLIVISAGIIPNSEVAEKAGLPTGVRGGIVVNDNLETQDPSIFAMGECALLHGRTYGLVAPGYEMAKHLVDRFLGKKIKSLAPLDLSTRLKMLGVEVTTIGDALQEGRLIEYSKDKVYRMLAIGPKRKLIGALGIGPWTESGIVQGLYSSNAKVSPGQERSFLECGEIFPNRQAVSPSLWPDRQMICNCLSVSKGEIMACLQDCQSDPNRIANKTGASTVCGSCRPLLQELCGAPVAAQPRGFGIPGLLWVSCTALLVVVAAIILDGAPIAKSVESTWYQINQLWRDNLLKQISGFSLMAIFLVGLTISLRKRFPWFRWGQFTTWRFFHSAFGLTALGALWAHTGFHFGTNLNFWLMFVFVALNLLGALAGIVSAIEARGATPGALAARRFRPALTWAHILLFWPLPILLTFHILSVYLY